VPGLHIPDAVIAQLEQARDPREAGIQMCVETIQRIRAIEGVAGIHVMATKKEKLIREIVHASGVLAGRPSQPGLQAQPVTEGQLATEGA
jgi:methylenetetrahydrofolate reductase (NADPH)